MEHILHLVILRYTNHDGSNVGHLDCEKLFVPHYDLVILY